LPKWRKVDLIDFAMATGSHDLDRERIDRAARCGEQREVDALFADVELPRQPEPAVPFATPASPKKYSQPATPRL
jgi:hypothetical protein